MLWSPRVKSDSQFVRDALNGFNFSGIITISSPLPQNALLEVAPSLLAPQSCWPTTTCAAGQSGVDGGVTGGVEQNASNAAGRTPSVPKNFFRGPTQIRDVDFRIGRDIQLFRERYKLQFFIEAFNLFNHRFITSVNTSAYTYIGGGTAATSTTPACLSANPCLNPGFVVLDAIGNEQQPSRRAHGSCRFRESFSSKAAESGATPLLLRKWFDAEWRRPSCFCGADFCRGRLARN